MPLRRKNVSKEQERQNYDRNSETCLSIINTLSRNYQLRLLFVCYSKNKDKFPWRLQESPLQQPSKCLSLKFNSFPGLSEVILAVNRLINKQQSTRPQDLSLFLEPHASLI